MNRSGASVLEIRSVWEVNKSTLGPGGCQAQLLTPCPEVRQGERESQRSQRIRGYSLIDIGSREMPRRFYLFCVLCTCMRPGF